MYPIEPSLRESCYKYDRLPLNQNSQYARYQNSGKVALKAEDSSSFCEKLRKRGPQQTTKNKHIG